MIPVVWKGERGDRDSTVMENLHERLGEAAIALGHTDYVRYAMPAYHAVDSLDPSAAVPGEAVGFGESHVLGRLGGGDEEVVEVYGSVPTGEQDLDRDRRGEAYARNLNLPG
jgi:hypothetical protein